ncbi:MAG TPA: hypothetical protein VKV26_12620 [Dehalococcoidia bacterium]|nr:hypothetical protein [Dehalococcoidia bacterium]
MSRFSRLLPLAIAPLLALGALPAVTSHAPAAVHAQVVGIVSFSPFHGQASDQRLVEFSGFQSDEAVYMAFTDPSGQAVTVSGYSTWLTSAQDDGTGAFFFRPSDWLDSLSSGLWTVTITGESSGLSAVSSFWIDGN